MAITIPVTHAAKQKNSLALSPVRVVLVRIPLGPRPSLHRLRRVRPWTYPTETRLRGWAC